MPRTDRSFEEQTVGTGVDHPETGLLLPFTSRVPIWRRFFGTESFTINGEGLLVGSDHQTMAGRWTDLVSAQPSAGRLRVSFAHHSGATSEHEFFCPQAEKVAALVRALAHEEQLWNDWQSTSWADDAAVSRIMTTLTWSGRPYVKGVAALFRLAADRQASDVHFEPAPDGCRVTLRQSGRLIHLLTLAPPHYRGLLARLKFLAGCHSHLTGIPQEGAGHGDGLEDAHRVPDALVGDWRFSAFPSTCGERAAVRFIRPMRFPDLASLGWSRSALAGWRRLLARGSGLLLITGPVGSGKTTALYASLAELAGREQAAKGPLRRLVTVEDPVEAHVPGICQSSLDPAAGLDLASAFKFMLRQDPDVLALGEIRDRACLLEALQAGLTGHLVLATFHAAGPEAALERLHHFGFDPALVSGSLRGLLTLQLTHAGSDPLSPDAPLRAHPQARALAFGHDEQTGTWAFHEEPGEKP
jgi:type II secretory ATPase GspE/PulE/Tfp pilus assembly ATPase PilB-like protein